MFDMQKMMKQAQEMQFKMQEMQEKLKEIEVTGQSGGGLVKVIMTCAGDVQNIDLDASLIQADEKEILEDLIVAAMNNANELREQKVSEETQRMMREAGLPSDALGALGGGF